MQKITSLKNWLFNQPIIIKGAILLVILGIGWFSISKLLSATQTAPTQYQTAQVEKGTIVVTVSSSGTVSSANSGSVTTQASGVVTKILVQNGQLVKTGQEIATFDLDQTSKQKYAAALSSYQNARNNLASAQAKLNSLQAAEFKANQTFMNGKGSSTDPDRSDPNYIQENANWLQAEADYKNQAAVIGQAQTSLNAASLALLQVSPTVTSPISGTVTGLSLQVGSVLTSTSDSSGNNTAQKIASIKTTAEPTITVNLTQVDVPNIKVGDKATLVFDSFTDQTFTGSVVSVDTIGSVSSGVTTYPAVIKLDSGSDKIFSNMTATANIITDSKSDVLLVPSAAVQTANGETTVRVMKNGTPTQVTVTTGLSSATQVEITSGLSEGDTVVTGTTGSTTSAAKSTSTTSVFSSLGGGNRTFGAAGGAAVRVRAE